MEAANDPLSPFFQAKYQGLLKKQGFVHSGRRSIRKRFFLLNADASTLYYFQKKSDSIPIGSVSLSGSPSPEIGIDEELTNASKQRFCFTIGPIGIELRTFVLWATTEMERAEWVRHIGEGIKKNELLPDQTAQKLQDRILGNQGIGETFLLDNALESELSTAQAAEEEKHRLEKTVYKKAKRLLPSIRKQSGAIDPSALMEKELKKRYLVQSSSLADTVDEIEKGIEAMLDAEEVVDVEVNEDDEDGFTEPEDSIDDVDTDSDASTEILDDND